MFCNHASALNESWVILWISNLKLLWRASTIFLVIYSDHLVADECDNSVLRESGVISGEFGSAELHTK